MDAVATFVDRQKKLLVQTYNDAWQRGVDSYGKGSAPVKPDPIRRAVALAPAFRSLNSMAEEMSTLKSGKLHEAANDAQQPQRPTIAQRLKKLFGIGVGITAAQRAAKAAGAAGAAASVADDTAADDTGGDAAAVAATSTADDAGSSLADWVMSNAWRLDAAASVIWAGEQAGYGEAADSDGQLLEWDDTGDSGECDDCRDLAAMPPQPLSDWPCTPGDGATDCNVGCRCSLSAVDGMSVLPGDTYAPQLSDSQETLMDKLGQAQSDAMASMVPDSQYLD